MTEEDVSCMRAECLRFAVEAGASYKEAIQVAERFMTYIQEGPPQAEIVQLREAST